MPAESQSVQSGPAASLAKEGVVATAPARNILLIGGTGYVGDGMRPRMRDAGFDVRLLVRSATDAPRYEAEGFTTAVGDITDQESLVPALAGVDAVVNLVGLIKEKGDATWERVHYDGTLTIIDAAKRAGVERVVQMSALGAGDVPQYPYHYTKWRAENALKDSGLAWTIFRPSIIFGPGEQVHFISQLADLVRSAPIVPVVGKGDARFQPVQLDDVADSFIAALRDPTTADATYDLAGPDVLTYEEILDEVMRALGKQKPKVHVPVGVMSPVMALLSALPVVEPPVTTQQLKMLKLDNTTHNNAVEHLTGHPPIPLRGNLGYVAR